MRAAIEVFQLIKEEKRRAFPERSYFKLKKKYPENISEFDSDKKIEAGRADTTDTIFNRELEFAKYLYEV